MPGVPGVARALLAHCAAVEKARMRPIVYSLVLCAACSSDPSPGGDDAPGPCEPGDEVVELDVDHGWALDAMMIDDRGPWVVLEKRRDNTSSFVIADHTGEVATLVAGLTETSGLAIAPVVVDGKRCIAMHVFDEQFRFACEDGSVEMPGLDIDGRLAAVQDTRGAVHVFGQDFAAYHELRREAGTWQGVEKFESSISTAQDAVLLGGRVASCFLSTGALPSIDLDGDISYGADRAQWCRLIAGDTLGVLTDLGLTTFTGSGLGAWQPTGLAVRPLAVASRRGAAYAVVHRDDRVELQPLPTGEPVVLRTLSGAENAHAVIDGDRVFVIAVKPIIEPERTRYELASSTRCIE